MQRELVAVLFSCAVAAAIVGTLAVTRSPPREASADAAREYVRPTPPVQPPAAALPPADLHVPEELEHARRALGLSPNIATLPRSTEKPPRPYEGLTLIEAQDKIRQQRRDDTWAADMERNLETRLLSLLGTSGERTARVRCYTTDCMIEIYTSTMYTENADLIFDVTLMLHRMSAPFSLFSGGETDRRLMLIAEFPDYARNRERLREFFQRKP